MNYKCVGIVCASTVPFLFSLHGDFVFDDSEAIIKNQDVPSDSWTDPFYNDFWGTSIRSNLSHKSYRPLTILSFRLNYILNNRTFSAVHFKITNLLCHVACCVVVWQTYQSILTGSRVKHGGKGQIDVAFIAALLFAVHPVHVEAVCGIVGRADILAALMFFLSFLSYIRAMTMSRLTHFYLLFTIILAAVSMLFKENGVTVLGFCIFYEIITKVRLKRNMSIQKFFELTFLEKVSVQRIIFLFLSVILLLSVRWHVMGGEKPEFKPIDNPAAFSKDVFTKVATYNYIYFLNTLLFVWPQWLCCDWSMGCVPLVEHLLDYRMLCIVTIYLYGVFVILALFSRGNNSCTKRISLLAISLAVIPFLPASNIFYPVGFVVAERVLYIPSAGYCLLLATGLNRLARSGKGKRYKLITLCTSLLICTYGLRSWQRSCDWQNEYNLFVSGLAVCPKNAKVHYNVAKVADARLQSSWALEEYKEAIRLYPEYYHAMNNLANLLKNKKNYAESESYLRTAISLKRNFPAAWMNLGIVLASVRRYDEALAAYQNALEFRKSYPDCLYNLGNLYLEMNKTENASEHWFRAININPKHVLAWTNLLALLDNTGQLEHALELIPKALTELPDSASVNFAIANIYGKLERFEAAERHFSTAISLFGATVQAIHYANLGVLYHRWKKYDLAKEMYSNALKINPQFRSARINLKTLQNT